MKACKMNVISHWVSVFVLCCWSFADVSSLCPSGKYGGNCEYDCHCKNYTMCDQLRGCNGICAYGWFGPSCQAKNVALRRPAYQNPGSQCRSSYGKMKCLDAGFAVDGIRGHHWNNTPCSVAGNSAIIETRAQWNVTLDQPYDIYRFIIDNVSGTCCRGNINRFVLSVGQSSVPGYNYRECYIDTTPGADNSPGPGYVIHGHCSRTLNGDLVQIRQTNHYPLNLCEVLVYVCGTGWYGEECNRECQTRTNCVRCDSDQTWCRECVAGKWGQHCEKKSFCLDGVPCDKKIGRCPAGQCAAGYRGPSCQTPCIPGEYGLHCEESCGMCAAGRYTCNTITGNCPESTPRCQNGYHGTKCDQECHGGLYEADCLRSCGQCYGGQHLCDRVTGNCPEGQPNRCQAGWSGIKCKTGCVAGIYGRDCVENCGQCSAGQLLCDRDTGNCPDTKAARCLPGWSGITCKTECQPGQYGPDCLGRCGQCSGGQTMCDRINGYCPENQTARCQEGWSGIDCKAETLKPAVIAGAASGALVGVVAIILFVYCIKRKRTESMNTRRNLSVYKKANKSTTGPDNSQKIIPYYIEMFPSPQHGTVTIDGNTPASSISDHLYEQMDDHVLDNCNTGAHYFNTPTYVNK